MSRIILAVIAVVVLMISGCGGGGGGSSAQQPASGNPLPPSTPTNPPDPVPPVPPATPTDPAPPETPPVPVPPLEPPPSPEPVPNNDPAFISSPTVSVQENTSGSIHTLVADDSDGDILAFSLVPGDDSAFFSVATLDNNSSALSFTVPPDFENPLDLDADNIYEITASVTDTQGAETFQELTIQVEDQHIITSEVFFPPEEGNLGFYAANTVVTGKMIDSEDGIISMDDISFLDVNGSLATASVGNDLIWSEEIPLNPFKTNIEIGVGSSSGESETISRTVMSQVIPGRFYGITIDHASNRLLIADLYRELIIAVDISTGYRSILSGGGKGTGQEFRLPAQVKIDAQRNRAIVLDSRELLAVDIATGNREVLTSSSVGNGPAFSSPVSIAVDSTNNLVFVTDQVADTVFKVDLATGDRTVLSSSTVGTGTIMDTPWGIEFDDLSGDLYVTDRFGAQEGLLKIDVNTGNRTPVFNSMTGSGITPLDITSHFVIDPDNNRALVTDRVRGTIIAVDLGTGDRQELADTVNGTTTKFLSAGGIVADLDANKAFVMNTSAQQVFEVDLSSGERTTLSDATRGEGLHIDYPQTSVLTTGPDGKGYFVSPSTRQVFEMDLVTGDRRVISSPPYGVAPAVGFGPDLIEPTKAEYNSGNGLLYVWDFSLNALFSVDPATGERIIVVDNSDNPSPLYAYMYAMTIDPVKQLAYLASSRRIFEVNLASGERLRVVDSAISVSFRDLVFDQQNNRLLGIDIAEDALLAIDLETTARTIISDDSSTPGLEFDRPSAMALDISRNRIVYLQNPGGSANIHKQYLVAIDLTTGEKEVLSDLTPDSNWPSITESSGLIFDEEKNLAYITSSVFNLNALIVVELGSGEKAILAK